MLLPLGTRPQQKLSLKGSVPGDMLLLHDSASLVTADWIDTWPTGAWSMNWTRLSRICPGGHRVRKGWVLKRKGCVEWVAGLIFRCTYNNEKTEKANRLREARDLSRHAERNRAETRLEREHQDKREDAVSISFPYGNCVLFLWNGPLSFSQPLKAWISKCEWVSSPCKVPWLKYL